MQELFDFQLGKAEENILWWCFTKFRCKTILNVVISQAASSLIFGKLVAISECRPDVVNP